MTKQIQEHIFPGLSMTYDLKAILDTCQSDFQTVDLVETGPFGRTLLLDGLMQSSEVDEFIYHESLVHPIMLLHPNPKRVFIGGGGEGSTAREVLRHKSVTECMMVDIDAKCVEFCRRHLKINAETFEDPRLKLIIDDCKKQLEAEPDGSFDVIILDLDDPLPGGPCFDLYTTEFYETCARKLAPNGLFVSQTAAAGPASHGLVFSPVVNTLKRVFADVKPYTQSVFSFGDDWGWALAAKEATPMLTVERVDELIEERIINGSAALRFLHGAAHQSLYALGKHVLKTLAAETRVLTRENPADFAIGTSGTNTVDLKH